MCIRDRITTDCYDKDNNISTVFFYQINIIVEYPQWEQYCFYFSSDLKNVFYFYYMNSNASNDDYSSYNSGLVWYEYCDDGSYLKSNVMFESYLMKNSTEYDNVYIPEIRNETD